MALPWTRTRLADWSTESPGDRQRRFERQIASQERAHTGFELGHREGFGQIVVGAQVQAVHAILDRITRREHDNTRLRAPNTKTPQDLETVDVGEPDVEHEEVVRGTSEQRVGILAARRMIDCVARAREDHHEPICEQPVVLDNKHAHMRSNVTDIAVAQSTARLGAGRSYARTASGTRSEIRVAIVRLQSARRGRVRTNRTARR